VSSCWAPFLQLGPPPTAAPTRAPLPVISNGVTIPRHSHQCDEDRLIALTASVRRIPP
jgi:hypothetical protein